MRIQEIIRRPLITEKSSLQRERHERADARGRHARQQDRDPARGRGVSSRSRSPKCGSPDARQGAPPGPLRRAPLGLEEGVRPAGSGREDHRLLRRRRKRKLGKMGIRQTRLRNASSRFQTLPGLRGDHREPPAQVADRGKMAHRRPQQPGSADQLVPRRRRTSGATATIDFQRDKDGVPGKVAAIEYDPNRSARIALLHYADGEKRYILAPDGLKVGRDGDVRREGRDQRRQRAAAASTSRSAR